MKKVVCLIAVLALTATVCAQEPITITAQPNVPSNGYLTIGYSGATGAKPVGISLIVDCGTGEVTQAADADFSIDSFFDVFIDFAADDPATYQAGADPATGVLAGAHGLAKTDAAGAVAFPAPVFAISAAELANPGGIGESGTICVLKIEGTLPATVCFSADTLRGEVVDVNGDPMDVTLPGCVVVVAPGPAECLKDLGGQEYIDWAANGKPDCWCFQRQCKGDANGLQAGPYWVSGADLTIFKGAFNQAVLPAGGICADFNHAAAGPYRVSGADLTIFKASFNQATVPCCDANGDCVLDAGDKYNFWTTP